MEFEGYVVRVFHTLAFPTNPKSHGLSCSNHTKTRPAAEIQVITARKFDCCQVFLQGMKYSNSSAYSAGTRQELKINDKFLTERYKISENVICKLSHWRRPGVFYVTWVFLLGSMSAIRADRNTKSLRSGRGGFLLKDNLDPVILCQQTCKDAFGSFPDAKVAALEQSYNRRLNHNAYTKGGCFKVEQLKLKLH